MINIQQLRVVEPKIVTIGSYPSIVQSILDFDYLSHRELPSIQAIIATGRRYERYFFGRKEVLIPVFSSLEKIPQELRSYMNFFLNLSSGRRVLSSTLLAIESLPSIAGGVIFAEDTPEKHAIELFKFTEEKKKFIIGPASVGLLIPQVIKLGAIGGVDYKQLIDSRLFENGYVAVFSASGGMTNELIRITANAGKHLSFALSFGGDRFPILTPKEAFLAAEKDLETKTIVYYGELGGFDEYEIVELIKDKKITKPIIAYIGGVISEMFEIPPQFGHAKAMAKNKAEGAKEKRKALEEAGVKVGGSFAEFVEFIQAIDLGLDQAEKEYNTDMDELSNRRHALIASSISKDKDGEAQILNEDLLALSKSHSFAYIVSSMFLGRKIKSKELEEFVDFVLRLLVDHGPYVSGAVNTIVASRAGRDLVSSLSAGILTIGPRFGGAINEAANIWIKGLSENKKASELVEDFAKRKVYISGIGHRKYRVDLPDPRVKEILSFAEKLEKKRFAIFAKEIEKVTVAKKGNLILNVDGAIAAVLLDILFEKEGYSDDDLRQLVETEFFNALFVLSRSVGFIAHFLDQKRLDEGLFRLPDDMVAEANTL